MLRGVSNCIDLPYRQLHGNEWSHFVGGIIVSFF